MPIISRSLLLSIAIAIAALAAVRLFSHRSIMTLTASHPRGDVYFVSHGGPPTMFAFDSPAHAGWKTIGKRLNASKPRGIVTVSAHWENDVHSPDVIVNVDLTNPLIYDFYGFPQKYYEQTFKSHGSQELVDDIKLALGEKQINVSEAKRGPDHGVWVPLLVGLNGSTDIPMVQVSLPGDSSEFSSAKLGAALGALRDKGYAILSTGQVVHNIRDFIQGRPTPYAQPFLNAASSALNSSNPLAETLKLFKHPLYKSAHPTPEHLLGLPVAVAATGAGDNVEEICLSNDGLGWGMWRWSSA